MEANKRLIAAAPDLLEALKQALPYIGSPEAPEWATEDAIKAINKATKP